MHHAALAPCQHAPPEGLRAKEIAGEVDVHHAAPIVKRQVDQAACLQDAGRIDQHIARAQIPFGAGGRRRHLVGPAGVTCHGNGPATCSPHLVGHCLDIGESASDESHRGTTRRQCQRSGPSDTAAGASDDADLAVKFHFA